jgi:hypothetical protein
MSELKQKITELFEKHRATPGASYDENHFLDFLLATPRVERAVYNSFKGLRRFNAFIDEVQYESAVFFSQEDRDANYSLYKFVHRIEHLQQAPRGSLASLSNRLKAGPEINLIVVGNLLLMLPLVLFNKSALVFWVLLGLAGCFNFWYYTGYTRDKTYLNGLLARIHDVYGIKNRPRSQNVV